MKNSNIGKREALSNNSTKYGYSLKGLCVKSGKGYRAVDGTFVETAVSTDASCIIKEVLSVADIAKGNVVVHETNACRVMAIEDFSDTTRSVKLFNLETGEIDEKVLDKEREISVLWDTFLFPEKVDNKTQSISMNEFTPAQLHALAQGKTTLEELRTPAQAETLEDVLTKIVKNIVKAGTQEVTQG